MAIFIHISYSETGSMDHLSFSINPTQARPVGALILLCA